MKADILEEKGAVLQADKHTYAIAPHIPGGFIDADAFGRMVDIAERYGAKALKITAGQRVAIIGLQEEDLDRIWQDLQMAIGWAIGQRVRMVKFCPGTTYCRHGKQDAMGMGMRLDALYHGYQLSAKFKIGVAGCEYACTAPLVKEIGLRGMPEGWTVTAGGNCGAKPRFGDVLAQGLNDAEAEDLVRRIIHFFGTSGSPAKVRLGRVIDKMGVDDFKRAVLSG